MSGARVQCKTEEWIISSTGLLFSEDDAKIYEGGRRRDGLDGLCLMLSLLAWPKVFVFSEFFKIINQVQFKT